ncbi:putative reverse transcriptase domain-containing protein [Tanacetum coccineum]
MPIRDTKKISQIKDRLKAARDGQKSYADKRRKPLEFSVGDHVLLKVSPWKGVLRFGKKGKLAPRFVGPFEIIEKVGLLAYILDFPKEFDGVHDTFHVSNLKKCLADPTLQISLDEIRVDDKWNFVEEPVEIMEREFKKQNLSINCSEILAQLLVWSQTYEFTNIIVDVFEYHFQVKWKRNKSVWIWTPVWAIGIVRDYGSSCDLDIIEIDHYVAIPEFLHYRGVNTFHYRSALTFMTGNRLRLKNFVKRFIGTIRFKNDHFGAIMGYGDYVICDSVISRQTSCYVRNEDGVDLLIGSRGSDLYTISIEDMMKSSPIRLLSKASKNKSWLWHRRLNHLNFGTINDLARKDLTLSKGQNLYSCVSWLRTMLIFSKALMFLWAEAVATAFAFTVIRRSNNLLSSSGVATRIDLLSKTSFFHADTDPFENVLGSRTSSKELLCHGMLFSESTKSFNHIFIDKCRIHISVCTDKSKITRKQSKANNHGHENQKSTKRSQRIKAEARKVKPQSNPVNHWSTKVNKIHNIPF